MNTSASIPIAMKAAFMPTAPPPMTITVAAATPGTPPSRIPRPPSGFSSMNAPAWVAILPAISLIGATCVAYETVEDSRGRLPLLAPMSEIAGKVATQAGAVLPQKPLGGPGGLLGGASRGGGPVEDSGGRLRLLARRSEIAGKIATQAGAFMLEKPLGGRGILLGGVPGVAPANVMIIGGGAVGMNAAFIAIGMEADVFVYDTSIDRLRELDIAFGGRASTVFSSVLSIEERLPDIDLVIGAVLLHGARAPRVIRREHLGLMKPQAVLVDVAIDQGGCFETSRPTTHTDPTYEVDGIIHYCVTNMPGAVPITSTYALTNATLPYVLALADHGVAEAARRDPGLRLGVNVAGGHVTHPAVADGVGMKYVPPEEALGDGATHVDATPNTDGAGATATQATPGSH